MARPKPFGILFRSLIPDAVRRQGYKAFGTKGYFGEYFNQNIYEQAQEHILGTEAQVNADDATIWYDDTAGLFKNKAGGTVTLADYDRIAMITDTADQDIDFPAGTEIVFVSYDDVDLDSNTLNLPETYSGELRVNNGSVVITGLCQGLRINGTATVNTAGMTGTAIVNGIIITTNLSGSIHNHADSASGGNTLDTPTISDLTNAQHDHSNAAGGGDTLNSPTIVTPTIADASNVSEVNSVKDQGGVSTGGEKFKIVNWSGWNMDTTIGFSFAHGAGALPRHAMVYVFAAGGGGNSAYQITRTFPGSGDPEDFYPGGSIELTTTNIVMQRHIGGFFDDSGYTSASGWAIVWYDA